MSDTYHLYRGADAYTLMVFGPYDNGTEWDVEVHLGHVTDNTRTHEGHLDTVTLKRGTHIVGDMFDIVSNLLSDLSDRANLEFEPLFD